MPDSLRSRDRLAELRERVGNYITALMVDGGSNVAACERAMDEAFDAVAALVESQRQELVRAERRQTVYLDLKEQVETRLAELETVLWQLFLAAKQYLDTGRGDLDGVLAACAESHPFVAEAIGPDMLRGSPS